VVEEDIKFKWSDSGKPLWEVKFEKDLKDKKGYPRRLLVGEKTVHVTAQGGIGLAS
jgi:hypothetical protein